MTRRGSDPALPLPRAGGDRGVGPRYRLDRPTAKARTLRAGANEIESLLWSRLRGRRLEGLRFNRQMPIAGFFADFVTRRCRPEALFREPRLSRDSILEQRSVGKCGRSRFGDRAGSSRDGACQEHAFP